MTDTHRTPNALVRSVDLYAWQDPKLPRFGRFDLTTRWRGRRLRAWREAEALAEDCITVGLGSFLRPGRLTAQVTFREVTTKEAGHALGGTRDP